MFLLVTTVKQSQARLVDETSDLSQYPLPIVCIVLALIFLASYYVPQFHYHTTTWDMQQSQATTTTSANDFTAFNGGGQFLSSPSLSVHKSLESRRALTAENEVEATTITTYVPVGCVGSGSAANGHKRACSIEGLIRTHLACIGLQESGMVNTKSIFRSESRVQQFVTSKTILNSPNVGGKCFCQDLRG